MAGLLVLLEIIVLEKIHPDVTLEASVRQCVKRNKDRCDETSSAGV